ncbi:peptidyl-prolyl cis-trans isomerase CYP63-like [Lactuca sativa]|uniref:peptidyl-prolyl cis-trans isomerase CYP63-like n=1 Tax=Lactuca sativa TaxID=4236 RepID=UPI0022B04BEA|nr:peptidyl-prolyl cis-trans isomerase CYP63-like [Lactuca sativa]
MASNSVPSNSPTDFSSVLHKSPFTTITSAATLRMLKLTHMSWRTKSHDWKKKMIESGGRSVTVIRSGTNDGKPSGVVKIVDCGEVIEDKKNNVVEPVKDTSSDDSSDRRVKKRRGSTVREKLRKQRKSSPSDSDSDSYSSESDSDSDSESESEADSDSSSSSAGGNRRKKRSTKKEVKQRKNKRKEKRRLSGKRSKRRSSGSSSETESGSSISDDGKAN